MGGEADRAPVSRARIERRWAHSNAISRLFKVCRQENVPLPLRPASETRRARRGRAGVRRNGSRVRLEGADRTERWGDSNSVLRLFKGLRAGKVSPPSFDRRLVRRARRGICAEAPGGAASATTASERLGEVMTAVEFAGHSDEPVRRLKLDHPARDDHSFADPLDLPLDEAGGRRLAGVSAMIRRIRRAPPRRAQNGAREPRRLRIPTQSGH